MATHGTRHRDVTATTRPNISHVANAGSSCCTTAAFSNAHSPSARDANHKARWCGSAACKARSRVAAPAIEFGLRMLRCERNGQCLPVACGARGRRKTGGCTSGFRRIVLCMRSVIELVVRDRFQAAIHGVAGIH